MGIGFGKRKLRDLLEEDERLFRETKHYYGIKELRNKEADPLKYERFHSRLLTSVIGARESVKFVAASPAVREYGELVFGLYTPEGDTIALSTGILVHVHTMSAFAKWMIRNNYEEDPGIRNGDVFANNETWAGGVHTADVQTLIPIFYRDELIGWAGGVTHELEVGAHEHGSMSIFSPERFGEGYHISAEKVGENDEYYSYYLNKIRVSSRMPNWWIMDEKARLAGSIMIRNEVLRVIEEFGIDYYMRTIREIIEDGRREFLVKIKERFVPGRFKASGFQCQPWKGLPHLHPLIREDMVNQVPVEVNVNPDGTIHIDFEGSSPWGYHPYNCTPSAMDGGLWVTITQIFAYDGKVNDGAYLCVTQHLPKGSIVNADYKYVATSIAWATLIPTYALIGSLLAQGYFARGFLEEVFVPSAANSLYNGGGINQFGETVGLSVFEMAACQSGGRAVIDGIDCGYTLWNPESDQGNAELWELLAPIVYLGRRFVPNSMGHGMYRGGVGWASLWMIWNTSRFNIACSGQIAKQPWVPGLFGGYPGPAWHGITAIDTNMAELIRKGETLPHTFDDVVEMVKSNKLKVEEFDIHNRPYWEDVKTYDLVGIFYTGGAGYGDPIERDPELVLKDLGEGKLTADFAEKMYGVKCSFDEKNQKWVYDLEATRKLREEIRRERLARAVPAKDWYLRERERILRKELPEDIKRGLRECMAISPKWAKEYREFWQLPDGFTF